MEEGEKPEAKDIVSIPVIFRVNPETGEKDEEQLVKKFNETYKDKYYVDRGGVSNEFKKIKCGG